MLPPAPLLALALLTSLASPTVAGDPDDFDPVLDGPPAGPTRRPAPPSAPGARFVTSGYAGLYLGPVRSHLEERLSTLEETSRAAIGVGFGLRTASLIEVGLEVALGLGQTLDVDAGQTTYAFDLIVEPRVLAHLLEGPRYGLYAGIGGLLMLFDLKSAGLNQAGAGPSALIGAQRRLDDHSRLYLEGSGAPFYDFLAFHYEPPGAQEMEADPAAQPRRVDGEWFAIYRLTVGYRLDF